MKRVLRVLRTASAPPAVADRITLCVSVAALMATVAAAATGHAS